MQFIYKNEIDRPEIVEIVREGTAIAVPEGFHPNVAGPDSRLCYIFVMASLEEGKGREFTRVHFDEKVSKGGWK